MHKLIGILLFIGLLLTGCTAVEPENRALPLIMSVDYVQNKYEVVYGIPDLAKVTGQDKKGESGSEVERITLYSGKNLKEVEEEFDKSQKNYLDMGHIKVIVFGNGILADKSALKDCLSFLESKPSVAGSILLFTSPQIDELMALNGYEVDSLGDYLKGMIKNKPVVHKEKVVTLHQFYNALHNDEEYPELLNIVVRKNQVYLE